VTSFDWSASTVAVPPSASRRTTLDRTGRHQIGHAPECRLGDLGGGAGGENVTIRVAQHLQAMIELPESIQGATPLGHIALDAKVAGDAARLVVKTDVVSLDPHRGAVHPAFFRFDVKPSTVEELAPDAAAVGQIVPEQIRGGPPDEFLPHRAVLHQHGVIDPRDALVGEDVVQHLLLIHAVIPPHRFVEHHEEETVQRLGEEQLELPFRVVAGWGTARFLLRDRSHEVTRQNYSPH
jgi:hypothetical protein